MIDPVHTDMYGFIVAGCSSANNYNDLYFIDTTGARRIYHIGGTNTYEIRERTVIGSSPTVYRLSIYNNISISTYKSITVHMIMYLYEQQ